MKLKNKYILRTVADKAVAIAVENGDEKTEGVITLNSTGAFIFALLNDGADIDEIAAKFFEEYDVTKDEATQTVKTFCDNLEKAGFLA